MEGAPLINEIYEAAILPEKWEQVLDQLAEMADAEGTLLFAAGPGVPRWLSSQSIRASMIEWTESKWFLDNPRGQRHFSGSCFLPRYHPLHQCSYQRRRPCAKEPANWGTGINWRRVPPSPPQ